MVENVSIIFMYCHDHLGRFWCECACLHLWGELELFFWPIVRFMCYIKKTCMFSSNHPEGTLVKKGKKKVNKKIWCNILVVGQKL